MKCCTIKCAKLYALNTVYISINSKVRTDKQLIVSVFQLNDGRRKSLHNETVNCWQVTWLRRRRTTHSLRNMATHICTTPITVAAEARLQLPSKANSFRRQTGLMDGAHLCFSRSDNGFRHAVLNIISTPRLYSWSDGQAEIICMAGLIPAHTWLPFLEQLQWQKPTHYHGIHYTVHY